MEKMKLPSFSGDLRSYAKFKSDFVKHVMPGLSKEDSAAYVLKSCLSGKAKEIIYNMDDSRSEMWTCLDEKYGDPSKLADLVIHDIRKLKPVKDGEYKRFIEFVEVIERGFRDLELLKISREMSNTGTVSLIEERLPKDIRREWSKEVNRRGSTVEIHNKFSCLL